jgi:DNA-binding transcriptional regulator YhcF (GntR family)
LTLAINLDAMKKSKITDTIVIDEFSATPKYQQLANSILRGIQKGVIQKGDMMPSINEVSAMFDISRVTTERGYSHLRKMGILESVHGKGYFIKKIDFTQNLKIFLLFNKLSAHKKIIYDAFVAALGEQAAIDFYIYNNDFLLFKKLIETRKEDYTHLVIIPHFIDSEDKAYQIINTLPKEKLILLDKIAPQITGEYGAVYENFEKDIYTALEQAKEQLSKYKVLKIIFPEGSYYSKEIVKGFTHFCRDFAFDYEVISSFENEQNIESNEIPNPFGTEGVAYLNLVEDDLIVLLEKIQAQGFELGKQVGIISYNETPLKRFILNGLTTVSTDFKAMGESAAALILNNSKAHIENPFYLTLRDSL